MLGRLIGALAAGQARGQGGPGHDEPDAELVGRSCRSAACSRCSRRAGAVGGGGQGPQRADPALRHRGPGARRAVDRRGHRPVADARPRAGAGADPDRPRRASSALPQPEAWDESAAAGGGPRGCGADIALFGEVQRTGTRSDRSSRAASSCTASKAERATLDTVAVPDGQLAGPAPRPARSAYLKALKIPATDAGAGARPEVGAPDRRRCAPSRLYVRGRQAAYRGDPGRQRGGRRVPQPGDRGRSPVRRSPSTRWAWCTRISAIAGRRRPSSAPPPSSIRPTPSPTRRSAICSSPRRAASSSRPIEAYGKAIELRPFYAEAHVGLGDANAAKGDVDRRRRRVPEGARATTR